MKDEIKEILEYFRKYATIRENTMISEIEDYITNLQEKLEVSQTNEETYRLEMQDITKILGLDEHTIFDEVKEYANNLQEENKKLQKLLDFEIERNDLKQDRIDKAIDYITTEQLYTNYQWGKSQYEKILKDLLNILQGEDNETR